MADPQQQQQQQQLQQQQQQHQQHQQHQQQQQRVSSAAVSAQQPPQPIMATANTLRSATPLPQLQVLPGGMHSSAYLPQFPYNQQQQFMLQNAAVQAAMQMNQLNIIQQGRAPNSNNSAGLLSPTSTQLSAQQAAQLAAAAANSNNSLAAVSMAMPVSNNSSKVASNGNKPQGVGQGQGQGQVSQGQGQTGTAPPALVAGKPAMLPQQSGAPLMLGQIANVFSQAGNVAPTFVTQSKGQSLGMPIQTQPQLLNSQSPIRLTQPQLVTNTGQIIPSQTMLTNPALLQAMAAGLQQQVWGLTSTGQLVQQTMLDSSQALQGGANPQGMQLAPQQLLGGQGQSQAFLAGQSLYLRPLQPTQQLPGMMAASMQGFTTLKGGKVQIEPNLQHQQAQQQHQHQQQQQQQQQQQLKAAMALGVKHQQAPGTTLGKTILPSTSRATVTAKIQPNMAATLPGQGPRLNIPTVIPKQKPRARLTSKTATMPATVVGTSTTAVPVAIPVLLSSGTGTLPSKVIAATSTGILTSASSSPSKPGTPVSITPAAITSPPSLAGKGPEDAEMESVKKATPTPLEATTATPLPTPASALAPIPTSSLTSPATTPIKTDTLPPSASNSTPTGPPALSPAPQDKGTSPDLKVAMETKEEDVREDTKEEEEEMEVEAEKPVMAVEALPPVLTAAPSLLSPLGLSLPPLMMEKQRAIVKPQILTHVIDGYVIQEGPEPFPVQRSSLLSEFVPPKPAPVVEKDSEDDTAEYDDQPPRLLNQSEAHFSGTGEEDMRVCEYCGNHRQSQLFRNSGRFCSTTCSKRYSVNCSSRVGKTKGGVTAGKYQPKKKLGLTAKKGWRTGHGGRLAYNINMRPAAGATEMSSSNSGQETSSSGASPPPQPDFDVEMEGPKTDPAKWSVIEVYEFVKNLPGCTEYADEFRQQEIDGQALLLLKEDHLMTAMSIKLGPALKICARINTLREEALSSAAAATTPTT